MSLFTGTQLVSGGFQLVIVGCFNLMISWGMCFFSYMGIHIGTKVWKRVKVYRSKK